MKQFAVIGLDTFGRSVVDELMEADCEILIVDKDEEVVNLYKDKVMTALIADVFNEKTIKKIIPKTIDAAVIDLGENRKESIPLGSVRLPPVCLDKTLAIRVKLLIPLFPARSIPLIANSRVPLESTL